MRRDDWLLLALPDGMSTGNPFNCHIQYLQLFPPSAWYSLHCHLPLPPLWTSRKPSVGSNALLWFFPLASFMAHTQTPDCSSLFPSRLVSSRLVSSEMTSVITSVSMDFNVPPVLPPASHCDPRSSALYTSDLLPRASFCHVSLLLQTPAALVLLWCLRETYAKSPVTLSAGYWLHFKNMMVKLQPRSNWQLCLGGHLRVNGLLLWPWC